MCKFKLLENNWPAIFRELLGTGSIHNLDYWKLAGLALGLLFSGELMETGGIHNSGYWKIAGLTACYFQGNSWKLGTSIVRVIGK